ncbi:MAG: DUF1858 domain-containing protein, partial [Parcubacteria group bacterium]|nr:DUF1858 domain-containing protein [Parcubacteria group bacterium]
MPITEILEIYPRAEDVMFSYGLHCTSCAGSSLETLEQGALGHGMTAEQVGRMVEEINQKYNVYRANIEKFGIAATEEAVEEIKSIIKEENKDGEYLKIGYSLNEFNEPLYSMDFEKHKKEGDQEILIGGINFLADKGHWDKLKGIELHFVRTAYLDGFRITKPK